MYFTSPLSRQLSLLNYTQITNSFLALFLVTISPVITIYKQCSQSQEIFGPPVIFSTSKIRSQICGCHRETTPTNCPIIHYYTPCLFM